MGLKNTSESPVGVIGLGSFGTAIANVLSRNARVIIYGRNPDLVEKAKSDRIINGQVLNETVEITDDLEKIAATCNTIFPIIPSGSFRDLMRSLSRYLKPYHVLIHGTKGLAVNREYEGIDCDKQPLTRDDVRTMSEVITEESVVVRVGCLAGPNIARELADGLPAATVVASKFNEVIHEGQRLLRTDRFQVYGNSDIIGIELAGVLKNIIAIAAGAVSGLQLGENARGLLISRGLVEMIYLGKVMGGDIKAFIGLAGVGDLVTTCTSEMSRNFTAGFRLAKGESMEDIVTTMEETAEGINTVKIMRCLAQNFGFRAPITEKLYEVMFEGLSAEQAVQYLMKYPLNIDVDFI